MKYLAALFFAALCAPAIAGDLQPPAGEIRATMKPLDRIEPRRCVNDLPGDEGAAHIITEDGSYYLCADIQGGPGQSGIVVQADNVTIDGRGFRLVGGPGSDSGIRTAYLGGGPRAIRVERIDLAAWGGNGFDLDMGAVESSVRLADVSVSGSGFDGILVQDCPDLGMSRCVSRNNAGHGVHTIGCASETLSACESSGNALSGFRSNGSGTSRGVCRHGRCFARANGDDGWSVARDDGTVSLEACVATDNTGDGIEITGQPGTQSWADISVRDGACTGNGGDGLRAAPGAIIGIAIGVVNVRCVSNGGSGIDVRCEDNAASARCAIDRCPMNGNGANGLTARVLSLEVSSSSCEGNTLAGLSVTADSCSVDDLSAFRNQSHGVAIAGPILEEHCKKKGRRLRLHCNGGDGMFLTDVELHASEFQITANAGAGLRCVGGPVRCWDGSCRSNGAGGISLTDCDSSHLERCRCESNTGDGLTVSGGGTLTVHVCHFLTNTGGGMSCATSNPIYVADTRCGDNPLFGASISSGAGGAPTPHFASCVFDRNGGDGLVITGAVGGEIDGCVSTGNAGAGLRVGTAPTLAATGMRIDRCYSAYNSDGIVVADAQNFVQRCTAASNSSKNLVIDPGNASGPNTQGLPVWTESKPYAWP
jgi:hypothetical protein